MAKDRLEERDRLTMGPISLNYESFNENPVTAPCPGWWRWLESKDAEPITRRVVIPTEWVHLLDLLPFRLEKAGAFMLVNRVGTTHDSVPTEEISEQDKKTIIRLKNGESGRPFLLYPRMPFFGWPEAISELKVMATFEARAYLTIFPS